MKEVINTNTKQQIQTKILAFNALYTWEEVYDWPCVSLLKA